jgi:C4-dicarboxylate-specific signal transduction histidine kinase
MLLDAPSPDLTEVREILGDIRRDDRWAGEIVSSMRALLRRREFEPQTLSLNDLVRATARLVGHDASLRGVSIDLDLAPDLPAVRGDPVHLQQALINLMVNGMDAMNGYAGADHRLMVGTAPAAGNHVQAEVSDSGPGIAVDALPRLFEPFFTTKQDGLGMGLSIARTVLEMHGGQLEAENRSGGGAVFRLVLPGAEGGK